jgi:hypothetical protein
MAASRLLVRYVGYDAVEFDLTDDEGRRLRTVVVHVGSGPSWYDAVRFPTVKGDATASTGDPKLDQEIREAAAAELVRLDAAVGEGRWSA